MIKIKLSCFLLLIGIILSVNARGEDLSSLENKASQLMSAKKYIESLKTFELLIKKYNEQNIQPPWWVIRSCANINQYYLIPKQPDKAVIYAHKLIDYNDKMAKIAGYMILTEAYWILKDYNSSIKYANLYLENGNDEKLKAVCYDYLANCYWHNSDFTQALFYAKKLGKDFWIYKRLTPQTIVFTFNFKLKKYITTQMPHLKPSLIKINLPLDTYYQNFIELKSSPHYKRIIKIDRYNYAEFDFTKGIPETVNLQITVKNKELLFDIDELYTIENISDDMYFYANQSSPYYNLEGALLQNTTKEIIKSAKTNKEKVVLIQDWISKNIIHFSNHPTFKNGSFSNMPRLKNTSDILIKKYGACDEFSHLFVSMCRVLKIPSRYIRGIMALYKKNGSISVKSGAHTVAEIYDIKKKTWVFIEPQKYDLQFGQNEQWLIIFESEMKNQPFTDLINFNHLFYWSTDQFQNYKAVSVKIIQDL